MPQTIKGAPSTPSTQVNTRAQASTVATWLITRRVASSPCCSLLAASAGMKAWLNAPSAKKRRNRLGMRNATLKASVIALAPKAEATSNSRTRPVIRDASVSSETVEAALKRVTHQVYAQSKAPILDASWHLGYNRGLCWQHLQTHKEFKKWHLPSPRKRTRVWPPAASAFAKTSRSTPPTPRCAPSTAPL